MFLKQNSKAKPTLKFLSPQKFIVSPKMVLQSKPSYVDKKVKQAPTIFSSHKTMTCWDVKIKPTAFWSQEIYSLIFRSEQLTRVAGLQRVARHHVTFTKLWLWPQVTSILSVSCSTETIVSYVVAWWLNSYEKYNCIDLPGVLFMSVKFQQEISLYDWN